MTDLSLLITDGTDEDIDRRARHLAIVSPWSYDDAVEAIKSFTAAMASITRTGLGTATALDAMLRSLGYETVEHSKMHAAYRAKTRRRNRR